ncbi:hypothetical protein RJ640_006354 [Escallonia rubra]|uniref:Pentatricopeptide repeat-containing protein n=1 Tax=Escallonia rubra TaxID=112253 RepID=A0AA88RIE8_9ASTE|nr:hypothetical protein RJ640_006354 [Escallonia rubra]
MSSSSSIMMVKLARKIYQSGMVRAQIPRLSYSTMVRSHTPNGNSANEVAPVEKESRSRAMSQQSEKDATGARRHEIGEHVSRKDKISFLVNTLLDLKDSKEDVYSALDAWVAWEKNFPIGPLKRALAKLEKEQQWRRVVQVNKWMLSKGQGTTMGTYEQLIRALDKDHRAEEAHELWVRKVGIDLHSASWQLCTLMMSVYYRNNMLDNLVKLFEGLEAFDRKPPEKYVVQRVADAYELLGLLEEKDRVLEKYKHLFIEGSPREKSRQRKKKSGQGKNASDPGSIRSAAGVSASDGHRNALDIGKTG